MHQLVGWFKQAEIGQSRSSTLNPLQWGFVILIGGLGICRLATAPGWITTLLGLALGVDCLLFFFAYLYFMFKDPDKLRSESYSLSKMAIERGLIGDSLHGILGPDLLRSDKALLEAPRQQAEREERNG